MHFILWIAHKCNLSLFNDISLKYLNFLRDFFLFTKICDIDSILNNFMVPYLIPSGKYTSNAALDFVQKLFSVNHKF